MIFKKVVGIVLVAGIMTGCSSRNTASDYTIDSNSEFKPSIYNVSIEDERISMDIDNVTTYINDQAYQIKLDINKNGIQSIDNYGNKTYIVSLDKQEGTSDLTYKEMLITGRIPDEIDLSKFKADTDGLMTYSNDVTAEAFCYINDWQLYTAENRTIKSEDIKQSNNDSIKKYREIMTKSEYEKEDIVINLEHLGEIRLSEISVLKDAPGIYYGADDNILRLYNYKDDIPYIFICGMNNPMMMNPVSNLVSTEWNNIYIDSDYNNNERVGYRSFAIMTSGGMYSIKIAESAPEGLGREIIDLLGIKKDDEKIQLEYSIGIVGEEKSKDN